jgi:hypothetical protein
MSIGYREVDVEPPKRAARESLLKLDLMEVSSSRFLPTRGAR